MALVIPPGFASAAFILTGAVGTQPYVTTIGLDISEAGGDFVAVANKAHAAYAQSILTLTSAALTLDRVTLSVGSDGPSGSVDSTVAPVEGSRSGAFPPTSMSAILRKTTNELGRSGRGRMFIPGVLSAAEVDAAGSVAPTRRATLNTEGADFLNLLSAAGTTGVTPAVLLHAEGGPIPSIITQLTCSDLVGWIRGRIR